MGKACHLIVDGLTATPPDTMTVKRFVTDCVEQAGLRIIAGPFFFSLHSHDEMFTVIAESHVSVKWFPDGLVLVDLFSCKPFDVKAMTAFTIKAFSLEHSRSTSIDRMGVG